MNAQGFYFLLAGTVVGVILAFALVDLLAWSEKRAKRRAFNHGCDELRRTQPTVADMRPQDVHKVRPIRLPEQRQGDAR